MLSFYDKHCLSLSQDEIDANLKAEIPFVIRQSNPTEGTTTFHGELFGDITVNNNELDDMVLIKSDGYPTYNFANVVDDHLMGITHVVRGSEYLSSTPKYNLLYDAFGWEIPKYIHCPQITDETHKKLSKRTGSASYEDLINQGYLPECILNFVALLGWSPSNDNEIFNLEELIKEFDYHRISKSPAVFDRVKLNWMNGEYIKKMDDNDYLDIAMPFVDKTISLDIDKKKIAGFVKTRIENFNDIPSKIEFFNKVKNDYNKELYTNKKNKLTIDDSKDIITKVLGLFNTIDDFSNDNLFSVLSSFCKENDIKVAKLMWPIRIALSGEEVTPAGATEIASVLGKTETIKRLNDALSYIG